MSQTVIVHYIFDIARDPMEPINTRNYQTAQMALEVILKANKSGLSVTVDANGDVINTAAPSKIDVAIAPSSSNPLKNFFLFFRPKSKPAALQPTQQPSDVIWTVINKMKIEIGIASTDLKNKESLCIPSPGNIINKYMKDAETLQTKAQISDLHAQWLAIQKDIADAKDGMQTSMDRLGASRDTKNSKKNLTPSKSTASAESHPSQLRKTITKINDLETLASNDAEITNSKFSENETKIHLEDAIAPHPATSQAIATETKSVPVNKHKVASTPDVKPTTSRNTLPLDMVAKINSALPKSSEFSGNYNEIVKATLTLQPDEEKKLYATLIDETFAPQKMNVKNIFSTIIEDEFMDIDLAIDDPIAKPEITDDDELLTNDLELINKQTKVDFGRATFIFEDSEGNIREHKAGADPEDILDDMKDLVSEYGLEARNILKTISYLPNQTTVATLQVPIFEKNPTKHNFKITYAIDRDSEKEKQMTEITYKLKRYSDGDLEFSFLFRQKITRLLASDGSMIPVNNQPQWKGPVDAENYGLEMSTKIRVPREDLITGNLHNVSIIEPVKINFQFQFNKPKA